MTWTKTSTVVAVLVGVAALATTIVGAMTGLDSIYARKIYTAGAFKEIRKTQQADRKRIDAHFIEDRIFRRQTQIWDLKRPYRGGHLPHDIAEEIEKLEYQNKQDQKKLDKMK